MQQVLFVGGTSYSGSTLLDMMLSHDPAGFSCGELNARVFPYRAKHIEPPCGCGDVDCDVWTNTSREPDKVHLSLFENFPDKKFLVDSSKSPIWIDEQSKVLRAAGIKPVNVLIWKTPAEFYASREKRGIPEGWAARWIDYHRRYFTLIDEWVSLPYSALVNEPRCTQPAVQTRRHPVLRQQARVLAAETPHPLRQCFGQDPPLRRVIRQLPETSQRTHLGRRWRQRDVGVGRKASQHPEKRPR